MGRRQQGFKPWTRFKSRSKSMPWAKSRSGSWFWSGLRRNFYGTKT